jgi:hypothetical protein
MYKPLFIIISLLLFIFSCQKDEIITDTSAKLNFSTDTLSFDTVFSSIGSTTRFFQVYNPHKKNIIVDEIYLAKGDASNFRLNINGIPDRADKVEISANDSIFIFVEVNVDPDRDEMVEKDSIIFITNNNYQDIKLIAFGQDVHLINGEIIETDTWTNEKPYLIYNSMLVDTNSVLTVEAGTQLYFHKNSSMFIQGSLIVNGTFDEPVVFQGDRLESLFDDVPDQWSGLHFVVGSRNNVIDYAKIRNANIGIRIDSVVEFDNPTLTISNSIIENMYYAGIWGLQSTIRAYNCVIADCGYNAVSFPIGGIYEFYHCTISNDESYRTRTTPTIWLNNYYVFEGIPQIRPLQKAYFGNCIIYGSGLNEIGFDTTFNNALNFKFENCLVRIADTINTTDTSRFKNLIKNISPNFVSESENNYELDTLSPAKDQGLMEIANYFIFDLNQNSRISDNKPDMGAYERIE